MLLLGGGPPAQRLGADHGLQDPPFGELRRLPSPARDANSARTAFSSGSSSFCSPAQVDLVLNGPVLVPEGIADVGEPSPVQHPECRSCNSARQRLGSLAHDHREPSAPRSGSCVSRCERLQTSCPRSSARTRADVLQNVAEAAEPGLAGSDIQNTRTASRRALRRANGCSPPGRLPDRPAGPGRSEQMKPDLREASDAERRAQARP